VLDFCFALSLFDHCPYAVSGFCIVVARQSAVTQVNGSAHTQSFFQRYTVRLLDRALRLSFIGFLGHSLDAKTGILSLLPLKQTLWCISTLGGNVDCNTVSLLSHSLAYLTPFFSPGILGLLSGLSYLWYVPVPLYILVPTQVLVALFCENRCKIDPRTFEQDRLRIKRIQSAISAPRTQPQ